MGIGHLRLSSEYNIPLTIVAFLIVCLVYLMNKRLRSRWTPRYLAWLNHLTWWPFIIICVRFAELFWLKRMAIVFWAFTFGHHFLNHDKVMSILC